MDFSLFQLILSFLFSIALGLTFGIAYEAVRVFHIWGYNKSSHYFITDLFFVIICTVISYIFCLVMLEGKVRMFVIAGEFLGFCVYLRLIAPITAKFIAPIIKFSKKVFSKLLKNCQRIMYNIGCKFSCLFSFMKNVCKKVDNKVNNKVKKYGEIQSKWRSTRRIDRNQAKKEKSK